MKISIATLALTVAAATATEPVSGNKVKEQQTNVLTDRQQAKHSPKDFKMIPFPQYPFETAYIYHYHVLTQKYKLPPPSSITF